MTETPNTAANGREPVIAPSRARKLYLILGITVVALLVIYAIFHFMTAGKEGTDDAQVTADVVAVAPRIAGQIANVYVHDNQRVHAGDLLAQIDDRDAQVKVAQAESDLATARAQADAADARANITGATARGGLTAAQAAVQSSRERVDTSAAAIADARAAVTRAAANAQKAELDWKRAQDLGAKGDISRAQVDAARAAHEAADADLAAAQARVSSAENARQAAQADVQQMQGRLQQTSPVGEQIRAAQAEANLARARISAAEAALSAAKLALSYTRIVAPSDGIASKLSVHAGSLVSAGQPIVQLVPLQTYVIANFKETQVRAMRPGERAHIRVDALGRRDFEGTVESLSGGTGASFSLLPPDNAAGNFVKVVQRVPVRIKWNGPTSDQLPVGASAEVTVYTE